MLRWKLQIAVVLVALAMSPHAGPREASALETPDRDTIGRKTATQDSIGQVALDHDPPGQDTTDPLSRARRALEAGRHQDAIRVLREALESAPRRPELWYLLGVALLEAGDPSAAVEAHDRSLQLAPDVAASWCGKGLALGALERYAEAATAFGRCAELSPDDPRAWLNVGVARLRAGSPADALPALRHAADRPATVAQAAPALLAAARQLAARSDLEGTILACGAYRDFLRASPDHADALAELAQLYAQEQLRADARATAGRVVELAEEGDAGADALIVAGNALQLARWPDQAARAFELAVELAPGDPWAHHHLGLALADQQRFEAALAEFREALRLDPDFLSPRVEAARAHLALGRPAEAVARLEPVRSRLAGDPVALTLLGRARLAAGDPAAAVEVLETALEEAREPELLYALAQAHERAGSEDRARELLREFEAGLQPTGPTGAEAPSARAADMWTAQGVLTQARIYLAERRFDEALALLDEARENRPDSPELRDLLAAAREGASAASPGGRRPTGVGPEEPPRIGVPPASDDPPASENPVADPPPGEDPSTSDRAPPPSLATDPDRTTLRLTDVTRDVGVDFWHERGASADKLLPETMGAGVAWLDHDVDGDWDAYFVQSGSRVPPAPDAVGDAPGGNVLYRNLGHAGFRPAPGAKAGGAGYGMGAASADYDGDGFTDLLVTGYGPDLLYRNNGDGTFSDVTAAAGLAGPGWSTSAGWGDLDSDGLPDLYVARYVDFRAATAPRCGDPGARLRTYCHVDLFAGTADRVYRNAGDGTFRDVTTSTGMDNAVEGKGLGVALGDLDGDGRTDVYVANDRTRNFLYLNRGDWTFEDVGLAAGAGYGAAGLPEAGMGVALGDVDGDQVPEIAVTNFAGEPTDLYRHHAPDLWMEDSSLLGIGAPTRATLGFGIALVDLDADGDLDLLQANGHIMDNVERVQDGTSWAQPDQLLVNRLEVLRDAETSRGLFVDATAEVPALARPSVSRGLAVADHDGDGRPDVAITRSGGPAQVLRNDTEGGHRLVLRLRGRRSNRDALGARVVVTPGQAPPRRFEITGGGSYLSQSATDLYVGLGRAASATVEVHWPSGDSVRLDDVPGGRLVLIFEGRDSAVALRPLARRRARGSPGRPRPALRREPTVTFRGLPAPRRRRPEAQSRASSATGGPSSMRR